MDKNNTIKISTLFKNRNLREGKTVRRRTAAPRHTPHSQIHRGPDRESRGQGKMEQIDQVASHPRQFYSEVS